MKIEVREDSVLITGYVNAVERYSKPITEGLHGKVRTFIERIKAGVFKTALKRNDDVKVLLNHDKARELATTKDGTAKLEEDNIGLKAEVIITDEEVVKKARNNRLVGWSFGFYENSDEMGTEGERETRTITDLDLIEVSILDDSKSPAYYGTSIEARSERIMEYRQTIEDIEKEAQEKHESVEKNLDAAFEENSKEHLKIEAEKKNAEMEIFAEMVATKVAEKLKGTGEEKTIPNPVEDRNEKIDLASYEERLSKL